MQNDVLLPVIGLQKVEERLGISLSISKERERSLYEKLEACALCIVAAQPSSCRKNLKALREV